jgi:hypothetical protein
MKKTRLYVLVLLALCCIVWLIHTKTRHPAISEPPINTDTPEQIAMKIAQIHEGMTFEEVAKILPISSDSERMLSRGGITHIVRLNKAIVYLIFRDPVGKPYATNQCSPHWVLSAPPDVFHLP